MKKYYSGIGSRQTPFGVLSQMVTMGEVFASLGFCLRSGAADGADAAFEKGCDHVKGEKEIFLPWKGFNDHSSDKYEVNDEALAYASKIHPVWDRLTGPVKRLHARNVFQVLGEELDTPSTFLVCWTPDGCERSEDRTQETGGSATAIAVASKNGIPVYNLANPGRIEKMWYDLEHIFGEFQ